jgi:dTDP-4-amino-4,6-dideoxygalactose transaminase
MSPDSPAPPAIPFNRPCLTGNEQAYMMEAVRAGHVSGNGPFTRRCQELLRKALGAASVLLTTSCTHALELAALLLDLHEGDEVIVPSFTFVSTANAFVLRGARPVFADVRPDTLNLDDEQVEALIGPRTRAVVPVHYAGVGCAMDRLVEIASRRGVAIVEDNAHGLFAAYRGRPLGSFGALATLSFHETKNFSCGEGGALILNDPALVERAEILREKGTDRSRFDRGQVDKYTWVDLGSSYVISDLLAAYLLAQLESRERVLASRRRVFETYGAQLNGWADEHGVRLPIVPPECAPSYHMFFMLMPTSAARDAMISHLRSLGIHSVFHYVPLHLSPMGRRFGRQSCPVTEDLSGRLLRLPFFNDLGAADQQRVIDGVRSFSWQGRS